MSLAKSEGVLDAMVAATMSGKAAAAAPLTPVGTERPVVVTEPLPQGGPLAGIVFPVEVTIESIQRHLDAALAELEQVRALVRRGGESAEPVMTKEQAADARAKAMTSPDATLEDLDKEEKAETASDFDVAFKARAAAAQAVTFSREASEADTADDKTDTGHWVCPQHGEGVARKTKASRTYHVCTKCPEFERLTA